MSYPRVVLALVLGVIALPAADLAAWQHWSQQEWVALDGRPLPEKPHHRLAERQNLLRNLQPPPTATAEEWLWFGRLCSANFDLQKANKAFSQAIALQADLPAAHFHLCMNGGDLSLHLQHLTEAQKQLVLKRELRAWLELAEVTGIPRYTLPFGTLYAQARRIQAVLDTHKVDPVSLSTDLLAYLDRAHWVLNIRIRLEEHSQDHQSQQRKHRDLFRETHHQICQRLLSDSPIGRAAFAEWVALAPSEVSQAELQSATSLVTASGTIDRPLLDAAWQPTVHHQSSRGAPLSISPGPLALAMTLDTPSASLQAISQALNQALEGDLTSLLEESPGAELFDRWHALLLSGPEAFESSVWAALTKQFAQDMTAGKLPKNQATGVLVTELVSKAPSPADAQTWLSGLIEGTERARNWSPVIVPVTADPRTYMTGIVIRDRYKLPYWEHRYKSLRMIWNHIEQGGVAPWFIEQWGHLPKDIASEQPWRAPKQPRLYDEPVHVLFYILSTSHEWSDADRSAMMAWAEEHFSKFDVIGQFIVQRMNRSRDEWRNSQGFRRYLKFMHDTQASYSDWPQEGQDWLLNLRWWFSKSAYVANIEELEPELQATYQRLYGDRDQRRLQIGEELLQTSSIGAFKAILDGIDETTQGSIDARAFMTQLWTNNPEQARAIFDHALSLSQNDNPGSLFEALHLAAKAIDDPEAMLYQTRAIVEKPYKSNSDLAYYANQCLAYLQDRSGVESITSTADLVTLVQSMERDFRQSLPDSSALFLYASLTTRWKPLATFNGKHRWVEGFLDETHNESGPVMTVVRSAAAMSLLRIERWSKKEKGLAERQQSWALIARDHLRAEEQGGDTSQPTFIALLSALVHMEYQQQYLRAKPLTLLDDPALLLAATTFAKQWPKGPMPIEMVTAYTALIRMIADMPAQTGWPDTATDLLAAGIKGKPSSWNPLSRDMFSSDYASKIIFDTLAVDMELLRLACVLKDDASITALLEKHPPEPPHQHSGRTETRETNRIIRVRRGAGADAIGGLAGTSACYHILIQHGRIDQAVALFKEHLPSIYHRPGMCQWSAGLVDSWPAIEAAIGDPELAMVAAMMLRAIPSVEQPLDPSAPRFFYDGIQHSDPERDQRLREQAALIAPYPFKNPIAQRACLLYTLDCPPAAAELSDLWIKTITALLDTPSLEGLDVRWHDRMREVAYRSTIAANRFDFLKEIIEHMLAPQPNQERHLTALRNLGLRLDTLLSFQGAFEKCTDTQLNDLVDALLALHQLPEPLIDAFSPMNGNLLVASCIAAGRAEELQALYDHHKDWLQTKMAGKLRWEDGLRTLSAVANRGSLTSRNTEAWLTAYFSNPFHQHFQAGKKPRNLLKGIATVPGLSDGYLLTHVGTWAELSDKPALEIASFAGHMAKLRKRDLAKELYIIAQNHPSFGKLSGKDQDRVTKAAKKLK